MAWATGLMGKAASAAGGLLGKAGASGIGGAGKPPVGPAGLGGLVGANGKPIDPSIGKPAEAGKGLLDEGMMGAMMQRGASGGGGKQAYQEGLTGGLTAMQHYKDMSQVGEKSALDPQMVFGMMNNMQYKPQQRQFVKPQWTPNNRRQQNRGLL